MCGIFGGIGINELEAHSALEVIQRGNDGITVQRFDEVILGSRRHLVKISNKEGVSPGKSDQPYISQDETKALVFNGELYNFQEVKLRFLQEVTFETEGDTEVWLRLYEKYGIEMLANRSIDSMFSLAIYDRKERKLHIARDWPGRIPLFYYYDKESRIFLFSSELRGLRTLYPKIALKEAVELCSGSRLTIDLETFEISEEKVIKAMPIKNPEKDLLQIGEELHARLHRSAKNRTMGDVPICTMLSGGIDSLLTTYYVLSNINFKEVSYRPTSYVFGVKEYDSEDVYRAKIAAEGFKDLGLTLKEIRVPSEQVVKDIPHIVELFETRKIKALSVYPLPIYYYLGPEMHKDGFKVTIGGHGVDELLGAYDSWKELNKPHEIQCHIKSRLAFINAIYENMLRRASIIFMERGPIEARFPFLQTDVCDYMLGIDSKWLSMNQENAERLLSLIEKRGGPRSEWGDKLPLIYDYLVQYLDHGGVHQAGPEDKVRTEVEKLFWKLPLMVAGMFACQESSMPFHLLFNAKLRGQHGAGLTSLEAEIVKYHQKLGSSDIEIYRNIVNQAFHLN